MRCQPSAAAVPYLCYNRGIFNEVSKGWRLEMSDVVAVALITSISTASVAIAAGLFGYWIERFRSRGETDRLLKRLESEERRRNSDLILDSRKVAVQRLQKWIELQVVMSTDVAALMLQSRNVPELDPLIRDRLEAIRSVPPEEASVNTVLSPFSSVEIVQRVRSIQDLDKELRNVFKSQDLSNAISAKDIGEFHRLWKPALELQLRFDEEIASLNLLLEKYVIGFDLA